MEYHVWDKLRKCIIKGVELTNLGLYLKSDGSIVKIRAVLGSEGPYIEEVDLSNRYGLLHKIGCG